MQYIWKLFKWESGTERTELSDYLIATVYLEPRCNGELSTGEIVLETPTAEFPTAFPPKTKLTLERHISGALDTYYDYLVDHDDLEEYAGCPERCCHRINLIAPEVFAQGLHCDNLALTYELNDVTLKYKTAISSDVKAIPSGGNSIVGTGYARPSWDYGGETFPPPAVGKSWYDLGDSGTHYYTNSYRYVWDGVNAIDNLKLNNNGRVAHTITFTMPIVKCYWNNPSAVPTFLFDCPTRCRVYRTTLKNGIPEQGTREQKLTYLYSNPNVSLPGGEEIERVAVNLTSAAGLRSSWIGSNTENMGGYSGQYMTKIFRENQISPLQTMINKNINSTERTIEFETDVLTGSQLEQGLSYQYDVEFALEPYVSGAVVSQYTIKCSLDRYRQPWYMVILGQPDKMTFTYSYDSITRPNVNNYKTTTTFYCRNMEVDADETPPFLLKGRAYNCFDLFRKAMLTCDTRLIDNDNYGLDEKMDASGVDTGIQYPIVIHSDFMVALKQAIMHESVFETKNLWEIIQQLGYYLHAVPYLEIDRTGKERFVLRFKKLGGTDTQNNDSTKLTVFNSLTLDNFFTQYDSYVTNLFSPQNIVDEWLVCKTSDSNYLVSNETAELHTKYNITEIIGFDIYYRENESSPWRNESALQYIFEKTVYDTLSAKTDFTPAKFSAVYYEMGSSKIKGLNYTPPTVNEDGYFALKVIVGKLFKEGQYSAAVKFNDLRFRIRYRTQDEMRITQVRPDLENFMKTSEFEKYPHHEQFYGQQDKIIDSERFSANLWGKLVRVANGIYQCQEYAKHGQEKIPGYLVEIKGEPYYVTECENEYYPDAVYQKVTYSKNFNQLSQIVTIPSEPRFYEVSERSMIRREVRLLDFIKISTTPGGQAPRFLPSNWQQFVRNLIFAESGNATLPNFAYTNFTADKWREHYNLPNNDIDMLYPKSEAEIVEGVYQPKASTASSAVIVPVLCFPMRNSIIMEWDMDDNFKAGDSIDTTTSGESGTLDKAFYSLQPVRYCDVYGRADLFDFKLFHKDDWTIEQARRLPFAENGDFTPTAASAIIRTPENMSIGLDKDNREALSFNYQLNLLHNDAEDFISFPNLFGQKNGKLKAALLNVPVSMFDESVSIDGNTLVADDIDYAFANGDNSITISFDAQSQERLAATKSIVFYDEESQTKYACIAKNVSKSADNNKLDPWYIYPVYNN